MKKTVGSTSLSALSHTPTHRPHTNPQNSTNPKTTTNTNHSYVGSYDDFGSLYRPPHSLSPDCHPYPVRHLDPLTQVMERVFDGVVEALQTTGSKQCGCRDDWPTACVTFVY